MATFKRIMEEKTMKRYTIEEVANLYGVSEPTVVKWIKFGELKAIDVSKKLGSRKPRYRVTEKQLEEFESFRETQQPSFTTPTLPPFTPNQPHDWGL